MQQYYIGKNQISIDELKIITDILSQSLFINDALDKKSNHVYKHIELDRCTFSKISFNEVSLNHINFNHCVFIECYFNKADLNKIDFNNCTFIKCSFNNIKFHNCSFFYTEWENNYIKFNALYDCLPTIYNHRSRLCKVMARNCQLDGNTAEYRKYFFEQIKSREKHYLDIIFRNTHPDSKYTLLDSIIHILKLLISKLNWLIWGYGERIRNIIHSSIFIIIIYSFIYLNTLESLASNKYITALYISLCNFLTISCDITFKDSFYRYMTISEGLLGIIFMGLFVTSLFKKINSK